MVVDIECGEGGIYIVRSRFGTGKKPPTLITTWRVVGGHLQMTRGERSRPGIRCRGNISPTICKEARRAVREKIQAESNIGCDQLAFDLERRGSTT